MHIIPYTIMQYLDSKENVSFMYDSLLSHFIIRYDFSPDHPLCKQYVLCESDYVWMRIEFPVTIMPQSCPDIFALLNELNSDSEAGTFAVNSENGDIDYHEKVYMKGSARELAAYVCQREEEVVLQYTACFVDLLRKKGLYTIFPDAYRYFRQEM